MLIDTILYAMGATIGVGDPAHSLELAKQPNVCCNLVASLSTSLASNTICGLHYVCCDCASQARVGSHGSAMQQVDLFDYSCIELAESLHQEGSVRERRTQSGGGARC